MKQEGIVVHCICAENGKSLEELLEESFRLYLVRRLELLPDRSCSEGAG